MLYQLCAYQKKTMLKKCNGLFSVLFKIKRNVLKGDLHDGGLSIIDVESKLVALKASWVPRLLNSNCILNEILNKYYKDLNIDLMYVLQFSSVKLENL